MYFPTYCHRTIGIIQSKIFGERILFGGKEVAVMLGSGGNSHAEKSFTLFTCLCSCYNLFWIRNSQILQRFYCLKCSPPHTHVAILFWCFFSFYENYFLIMIPLCEIHVVMQLVLKAQNTDRN